MSEDDNRENSKEDITRTNVQLLLGIAAEYIEEQKYEEAEKILREATISEINDKHLWAILGRVYMELKKFDESEAALRRAVLLDLMFAGAWFDLGIVLLHKHQFNEAEAAFDQYDWLKPEEGKKRTRALLRDAQKRYLENSEFAPLLDKIFGKV
ncbi:MAG: tetratricopeptide repeat protein [Candidatus Thorarchaeota archaeon]